MPGVQWGLPHILDQVSQLSGSNACSTYSTAAALQWRRKVRAGCCALGQGQGQGLNVTGSVNITNETDGPDTAVSAWSGSFTVNDSSSPQETVSYLARVVAFGEQAVTHQAGSFDAQTLTQNLSIVYVEQ